MLYLLSVLFVGASLGVAAVVPADEGSPASSLKGGSPSYIINGESRYPITNTTMYSPSSFAFLEGSKANCSGVYWRFAFQGVVMVSSRSQLGLPA